MNSYDFPENVRIEVDDDAPEETKSHLSSINSQVVSRSETPIEVIERNESNEFVRGPVDSPITISSSSKLSAETDNAEAEGE